MYDWNKVKDKTIIEKVRREAEDFMKHCHFGSQGISKTEKDIRDAVNEMLASDLKPIAFDTEMNWVPLVKEMTGGSVPIHAAVSYPMGRAPLSNKFHNLETLLKMGVTDTCVVLDWQAIFSQRYKDVEYEAKALVDEFGDKFEKNAFVIPATYLSDTEIIRVCSILDDVGVESIKVNPGANMNVSFEEVALIQRIFPGRFDIHPSGGIRTLDAVERFRELGCDIIHTRSSLEIVETLIERQLKKYGGMA